MPDFDSHEDHTRPSVARWGRRRDARRGLSGAPMRRARPLSLATPALAGVALAAAGAPPGRVQPTPGPLTARPTSPEPPAPAGGAAVTPEKRAMLLLRYLDVVLVLLAAARRPGARRARRRLPDRRRRLGHPARARGGRRARWISGSREPRTPARPQPVRGVRAHLAAGRMRSSLAGVAGGRADGLTAAADDLRAPTRSRSRSGCSAGRRRRGGGAMSATRPRAARAPLPSRGMKPMRQEDRCSVFGASGSAGSCCSSSRSASRAHKADTSQACHSTDEFKLDTWFNMLGPLAFNKGVLYLLLAARDHARGDDLRRQAHAAAPGPPAGRRRDRSTT